MEPRPRRRTALLPTPGNDPASAAQPSRAELVRQRRAAEAQNARRPVVSKPARRAPPKTSRPNARRRYAMELTMGGEAVALPALPELHFSWRWISLSAALLVGALFLHLLTSPAFRVDGLDLIGASIIPGQEVLAAAGVQDQPVFLVDPRAVKSRVEAVSGVESAQVSVDWPARVTVVMEERAPVIAWQQGGQTAWVDETGRFFDARGEAAGLLPIAVDDEGIVDAPVPAAVVQGALQLKRLRPNIELLHYDRVHGLSYQDGRGWRGYFGSGTDMDVKLKVYETLVDQLLARQILPSAVSVENVDAAYYRSR